MALRSSSLFGTAGIATSNLVQGDLDAALRSFYDSDSLSPKEAQDLVDKAGLSKHPLAPVFRMATNPIVILGLALALHFPVTSSAEWKEFSLQAYRKARTPGFLKGLKPLHALMKDTPKTIGIDVPGVYSGAVSDISSWYQKFVPRWQKAFDNFGRKMTPEDKFLIAVSLDDVGRGLSKFKMRDEAGKVIRVNGKPVGIPSPVNMEAINGALTTEHKVFIGESRGILDDMFTSMFNTEYAKELIQTALDKKGQKFMKRFINSGVDDRIKMVLSPEWNRVSNRLRARGFVVGDYLPNYLPRMLSTTSGPAGLEREEHFVQWLNEMSRKKNLSRRAITQSVGEGLESEAAGSLIERVGGMMPDPMNFDVRSKPWVGKYLNQEGVEHLNELANRTGRYAGRKDQGGISKFPGDPNPSPPLYSLDFSEVIKGYTHATARTYALTATSVIHEGKAWSRGSLLKHASEKLRQVRPNSHPGDIVKASMLEDQFLPILEGRLEHKQALAAQEWAAKKMNYAKALWSVDEVEKANKYGVMDPLEYDFLKSRATKVDNVFNSMPGAEGVRNKLKTWLETDRGPFTLNSMSGGLAGLIYASTIGGNVGAISVNSLQVMLTTVPLIGLKAAGKGLARTVNKLSEYADLRLKKGIGHREAFSSVFKDFTEAGLAETPLVEEALGVTVGSGLTGSFGKTKNAYDKAKGALLAPFGAFEMLNRLVTFEGGASVIEAEAGRALSKIGGEAKQLHLGKLRHLVNQTQFVGGPHNTPYMLAGMNPLLRQYAHFSTSFINYLTDTLPYWGSGAKKYPLGINWGNIGRLAATGGIAYEAGQALGVDLSPGLITGALPAPREGNPFYPMPFVPPIVAAAGSVAMDIHEGKLDKTRYAASMFVPGGLQASKMSMLAGSPQIAKALGRKYVDWNNVTMDGRVAVYTEDGKLVGYETPAGLFMNAVGIPGAGDLAKESELMKFLVSNRDRIHETRKRYMDAFVKNDYREADAIAREYQQAFGFPLQMKDSDWRALEIRRSVPRMESVIQTLPAELRPIYAEMLYRQVMSETGSLLGYDPRMLGSTTPTQRASYRPNANRGTARSPSGYPPRRAPVGVGSLGLSADPYQLMRRPLPQPSRDGTM